MSHPLVSLVIVNYEAARFLVRCVESLRAQEPPGWVPRTEDWLELLVIDNASGTDDRALLATLPSDVWVYRNPENVGYARAVNQGLAKACGEFLGFLNPDVLAFPGALATLVAALEGDPGAGAAGPRTWWDEERTLWLPPQPPRSLAEYVQRWVAAVVPRFGRWSSRRWARDPAALWRVTCPTPVTSLPGSFLLTRRRVLETVGGLDPRFPLYFEDVDWCRRLRDAGLRLLYVPEAEVTHFYNQSAQRIRETARQWLATSEQRYLDKHYGWTGRALYRICETVGPWLIRQVAPRPVPPPVDLGTRQAPVILDCSDLALPVLIQISLHWGFLHSAFTSSSQPTFSVPGRSWERLESARYYARALDPMNLRTARSWTWEKG